MAPSGRTDVDNKGPVFRVKLTTHARQQANVRGKASNHYLRPGLSEAALGRLVQQYCSSGPAADIRLVCAAHKLARLPELDWIDYATLPQYNLVFADCKGTSIRWPTNGLNAGLPLSLLQM
jgi:hypothetical protein